MPSPVPFRDFVSAVGFAVENWTVAPHCDVHIRLQLAMLMTAGKSRTHACPLDKGTSYHRPSVTPAHRIGVMRCLFGLGCRCCHTYSPCPGSAAMERCTLHKRSSRLQWNTAKACIADGFTTWRFICCVTQASSHCLMVLVVCTE